jgi:predicted lipoprotein with Yx(FWY)xxD motif
MMKHTVYAVLVGVALLVPVSAQALTTIADADGMVLYTFDKDVGGVSACYDSCAVKWPPYLGKAGEAKGEGWTLVERTDGTMQWAYDGKPMYHYQGDMKAGDAMGDGMGGMWHVIKE